jgi:hypothetical protein
MYIFQGKADTYHVHRAGRISKDKTNMIYIGQGATHDSSSRQPNSSIHLMFQSITHYPRTLNPYVCTQKIHCIPQTPHYPIPTVLYSSSAPRKSKNPSIPPSTFVAKSISGSASLYQQRPSSRQNHRGTPTSCSRNIFLAF